MSALAVPTTTTEHTDRGPLDKHELAAVIARDIPAGAYVNLGIGQPTLVADHLPQLSAAADAAAPLRRRRRRRAR